MTPSPSKGQDLSGNGIPEGAVAEIYLIERLWTDPLENDAGAAFGYSPEGFATSSAEAELLVAEAGVYSGSCWALHGTTPQVRRMKLLPRLPRQT